MADYVLLRFRDLTADVDTIDAHNTIVEQKGSVIWGWWKKPPEPEPDPGLSMLLKELERSDNSRIFFIDSANRKLYRAPLFQLYYHPGAVETPPPDRDLCPDYYENKHLPAWFRIGKI